MAPADVVLSSNVMNAQLKEKKYPTFFLQVDSHFRQHPNDFVSAYKFCTAVAFHLYHNPCRDEALANMMLATVETAFDAIVRRAEAGGLGDQEVEKVASSVNHILVKGFLRDFWLRAARKSVDTFKRFFQATGSKGGDGGGGNQEMLEFLQLTEACVEFAESVVAKHRDIERELRQLLLDNKFAVSQYELKVLHLHIFRLEVCYLQLKASGDQKLIPNLMSFIELALAHCQQIRAKGLEMVTINEEKVLLLCSRCGGLFRNKCPKEATQLLEFAKDTLNAMIKEQHVPSVKILVLYHDLYELYYDAEAWSSADTCLQSLGSILAKVESVKNNSSCQFTIATYRAFLQFSSWRLKYEKLQREAKVQMEANAKLESATTVKTRDGGDCEDAMAVGDTNPYLMCLTLEVEEDLNDMAKAVLTTFLAALRLKTKELYSTHLTTTCILKMITTLAEFFRLIGQQEQYLSGMHLLLKFSREFGNDAQEKIAQSALIRHELDEAAVDHLGRSSVQDATVQQVVIPAAFAWRCFGANRTDEALGLATAVLHSLTPQRPSTATRILSGDMKLLLALCRCSSNSFVTFPAQDKQLGKWQKESVENGPIELIYEAFKDVSNAAYSLNNTKVKNLSWCSEIFKAANLQLEVLSTRTELYLRSNLSKEMRLYAKLQMELAQKVACSTRYADSLLVMVELDIRCDDTQQALGKLNGVKYILSSTLSSGSGSGRTGNGTKTRSKLSANTNASTAASPLLHRSEFSVPAFFNHIADCCCYKCSNVLLPLVVIRYFNFSAVLYSMTGEVGAAQSFFDGTLRLVEMCVERVEKAPTAIKELAFVAIFNVLQWQGECLGRNDSILVARELLLRQRSVLAKIPATRRNFPSLAARYFHQAAFLEVDVTLDTDDDVADTLKSLALSSPILPSSAKEIATPTNFKTPALRPKNILPRKPTKKLLPLS